MAEADAAAPEATPTATAPPRVAKRRGRPPILTSDLVEQIALPVRAGNPITTAAAYAGVDRDTLYDWLKKGAKVRRALLDDESLEMSDQDAILVDFSDALRKAMAEASIRDNTIIGNAADKGAWQAAAWRRERREPANWGRAAIYERSGDGESELLPPDERDDKIVQTAVVLPAVLPAELHDEVVARMRDMGKLPGQVDALSGIGTGQEPEPTKPEGSGQ